MSASRAAATPFCACITPGQHAGRSDEHAGRRTTGPPREPRWTSAAFRSYREAVTLDRWAYFSTLYANWACRNGAGRRARWTSWPASRTAQQNQPIYPVYDGFLKNPDGSYTLSFAYFSHNADVVTIPPGAEQLVRSRTRRSDAADNASSPGHWRFQCVMVVGPEFDGKMKWTLAYAGTTTGTSERMLQSNWNLLEGATELAKIDYAKVPRGVCLNRPPQVRVLGVTTSSARPANVACRHGRAVQHLRQRARRRAAAREGDSSVGWKMVSGSGHRHVFQRGGGAHQSRLQRARHLRARTDGHAIRSSRRRHAST